MAELVSCCFSLSLLLAKNRFVLSDLAGMLSSCLWSRGIENTVNISSLQMLGCSFPVSGAIRGGRAREKVFEWEGEGGKGGGGRADIWPLGGSKE